VPPAGPPGPLRRAWAGVVRIGAIALTVRSQSRRTLAEAPPADVYHGMAYMGIPIAIRLARRHRARVVYDARDIYLDAGNLARLPGPARRLVGALERRWARGVDRVITVNDPYADVMQSRWGTPRPLVVMNCSYRFDPPNPRVRLFHERLGLDPDRRIVLYHGGLSRDRGIEQLVDAIEQVPGGELVVMGYGALWGELERRVAAGGAGGRLHLLPPVEPADLLRWVAAADVVAVPIQPSTLNHRLTTPNKLLEAIAVGVPVVASDLPGMAGVVNESGAGILVDSADPAAIAAAIRALIEEDPPAREIRRRRILASAHATYNWEVQAQELLAEYSRLTGQPW
jgi:glycosyltransferase involved in cell wall biosynthesis